MKNIIKIKSKPYHGEDGDGIKDYECQVSGYTEDLCAMLCLSLGELIVKEKLNRNSVVEEIDRIIEMMEEEYEK